MHRDCYGMPTYNRKEFQCWACQAVGRTFHVHNKEGKRLAITQTERPRHCELCGYNPKNPNLKHAMHPIYDNYGCRARQLYLLDPAPRLAWAHTICGFFLATKGLLYAVTREGTTHEGDDSDEEDDRSINSELAEEEETGGEDEEDPFQGAAAAHHFVWHREAKWRRAVKDHQLGLKCEICKKEDYSSNPNKPCFRIPVQCSANDPTEYPLFRSTHSRNLQDHETCISAFHVGCARWSSEGDENALRRVYYFPGLVEEVPGVDFFEPIRCLYCPLHSSDVNARASQKVQAEVEESSRVARLKRKRAMVEHQGRRVLSIDTYNVHESTAEQQDLSDEEIGEEESFLDRMKHDIEQKVLSVTRENAKPFIKEEKRNWQRLALQENIENFDLLWKEVKAHANSAWRAQQQQP